MQCQLRIICQQKRGVDLFLSLILNSGIVFCTKTAQMISFISHTLHFLFVSHQKNYNTVKLSTNIYK